MTRGLLHVAPARGSSKDLHDLVGELSTRSDAFRTRWATHNVSRQRFHHPVVGDQTLAFEALAMAVEPGLTLTIYTAEPGSPFDEGLKLLASWAASQNAGPHPEGHSHAYSGVPLAGARARS
ncbi:hypothetical protein [Streptomyces sp. MC1]|uniref:MmyB family transcriptional regulator n=1 Tax=Streptomyces sp. MC1 TaxID=295105 RepID=UPI0022AC7392|nr:hypothetical protein [Streptomyces sp. MC1]